MEEKQELLYKLLLLNDFYFISRDYGDKEVWAFEKKPEFNQHNEFTAVRKSRYALVEKQYVDIDLPFEIDWIQPGDIYNIESGELVEHFEEVVHENKGGADLSALAGMTNGGMENMIPPIDVVENAESTETKEKTEE